MAAVTIRNLSDEVVEALKQRAKRNGRSMEAEIREALTRLAADGDSGLEDNLARQYAAPRRSVPMSEVAARLAAHPRTAVQRRIAREWSEEIEADRRAYPPSEDDFLDPWERAELHLQRLKREQGK